jgi:hypothetical protein
MNTLANGTCDQVCGWTIEGGALPRIGDVYDLWPTARLRQHYPEYTIIDPQGNTYTTFSLWHFEQKHKISVATKILKRGIGVSAHINGLTANGEGWRLSTIPTYTIIWGGITYANIISPSKFCKTHNVRIDRFVNYIKHPVKNTRQYHIEKN